MNKKFVLLFIATVLTALSIFQFSQSQNAETLIEVKQSAEKQGSSSNLLNLPLANAKEEATDKAQGELQCEPVALTRKQYKQVFNATRQLVREWQQREIPEYIIDYVTANTGLGVWHTRRMRAGYQMLKFQPAYVEFEYPKANSEQQSAGMLLTMDHDLDSYFNSVGADPDKGDVYHLTSRGHVFLLELLISSYVDEVEEKIVRLLETGVKVHVSDVFAAVRAGLPRETVEAMLLAGGIAADVVVQHNTQKRSLLSQAVVSQHVDLIDYFISQGVNPDLDPHASNVLDLLGKHNDELSEEDKIQVFEALSGVLSYVNFASGLTNLVKIFGEDTVTNAGITVRDSYHFSEPAHAELVEGLTEELRLKLAELALYPEECSQYSLHLLSQLREDLAKKSRQRAKKAFKRPVESYIKRNKLLAGLKKKHTNEASLLEALKQDQSMIGKELLDSRLLQQSQNTLKRQSDQPELTAEQLERITEAVQNKDYDAMEQVLIESTEDEQELLDAKLMSMLMLNPNVAQIAELIDQGANVPKTALLSIMQHENIPLAELLVRNGAEITPQAIPTLTPVIYAVSITSNTVMLEWLLENGGNIDKPSGGRDAIDHALSAYQYRSEQTLPVLAILFRYQNHLEVSHKEAIAEIKSRDSKAYEKLIKRFPFATQ